MADYIVVNGFNIPVVGNDGSVVTPNWGEELNKLFTAIANMMDSSVAKELYPTRIELTALTDDGSTDILKGIDSGSATVFRVDSNGVIQAGTITAGQITGGNTAFNKNFGNSSGTVCEGSDSRLSDNRTDGNAIHDNVAAEISPITEKVSPANSDVLILEDSADSFNKKKVQIGNLPSGGGSGDVTGPGSATDNAISRFDGTTGKTIQSSVILADDDGRFTSVASITFNTAIAQPSATESAMYWDPTKKSLCYWNDSDTITCIGRNLLIRVRNETGSTITKGKVVYPSGVSGGKQLIDLANSQEFAKCRLNAVVTSDIANNSDGFVTYFGELEGLDTSSFAENDILYLSATTDGEFTTTRPDDGAYATIMGSVRVSDPTDGVIIIGFQPSELTVEVTDTNGFPSDQRSGTTLAFDNGTRTFTIQSTGTDFHYYQLGSKYEKSSAQTVVIPDEEGLYLIYFFAGILDYIKNPSDGQISTVTRNYSLVAYIYWDATNSEVSYFGDERHGISMSPETHTYLHFTRGAQFLSGLGIGDILADDTGNLDSHAQFSIESGFTSDEDLLTTYSAIASTVGLPIYYLDGANADLRRTTNSGFSIVTAGTGRMAYNEWTGSTWQLTEITNINFALCHIFAINGYTGKDQQIAVVGQNEYTTLANARLGASTEISNLLSQLPFQEIVAIGTVIFQTSNGYTNAVKSRIRTTDLGDDYVDWRTTELAQGTAPSAHGNLTGLNNDDHTQYALLAGRSGGQVLNGGTDASDDITISSTSNATKGLVKIEGNLTMDDGTTEISSSEFNTLKNVTSNIQTQLNSKASTTDLTTHTSGTAVHGASGAVVGTTNTQTLTNKTLTTPKIAEIQDSNGNEVLKLNSTASAVNEVSIKNEATGNNPEISPSGGDSNIDLELTGKGTGGVTTTSKHTFEKTAEFDEVYDNGNSGAAKTINLNNGNKQKVTINSNTTLTISDRPIMNAQLEIIIDGTGGYTITLAASAGSILSPNGGETIEITTTANAKSTLYIFSDGTDYRITSLPNWTT